MDLDIQKSLWIGMEGIPKEERLREYAHGFEVDYPVQASQIHSAVDCFVQKSDALQCLSPGAGTSASGPRPTSIALRFGKNIGNLGELALKEKWDLNAFAHELEGILSSNDYSELKPADRAALSDLVTFYARRLPENDLKNLRTKLKENPAWARRLQAYESRSALILPFDPSTQATCRGKVDWERHAVAIDHTKASVPVFAPRGRGIPWALYENVLKAEFETIKLFLTPADFERVLRPHDKAPLHFYIGGGFPGSEELLHACDLKTDDRAGEYSDKTNHIMSNVPFRNMNWAHFGENPRLALGSALSIYQVLHHEIGHAIYHRLLTERQRKEFRRFFEAMVPLAAKDSDYIPNSHIYDSREPDKRRHYGMTNEMEFFAEMFTEYLSSNLSGQNYGGRSFAIRKAMMDRFFAEDGIHPEVFSREAVEAAFQSGGVPLQYPMQGYVNIMSGFVVNSAHGLGMELLVGARGISQGKEFALGGAMYVQPGFQNHGSIGFGLEGNVSWLPSPWLGLEALGRFGMRGDFLPHDTQGVAGGGLRVRLWPNSLFQLQAFAIPQVDLGTGHVSVDAGGGFGVMFQ